MSILKAGKVQSGISLTPANNLVLDASADDGSFQLKRGDGTVILSVSVAGIVDIKGSGDPYGTDNILGTVSQSGGVPTGAVIEQGTNANGTYTRFADGTLICTHSLNGTTAGRTSYGTGLYQGPYDTWTYPTSFVDIPNIIGTSGDSGYIGLLSPGVTTLTSAQLKSISPSATVTNLLLRPVALGRWF